jgi:hypothetical protein
MDGCLRIRWVGSDSPDLKDCLSDDRDFYRPITLGPADAPLDATSAKIEGVAVIRTSPLTNPIYFDELRLTSTMMPNGFFPLSLKNYRR